MTPFNHALSHSLNTIMSEDGSVRFVPTMSDSRLSLKLTPEEFVSFYALCHDPAIEAEVQKLHDQQMSQEDIAPALKRAKEYNAFILGGGEMKGPNGTVTRVEAISPRTLRIDSGNWAPSYDVPYDVDAFRMYPSQKEEE